MPVRTPQVNKLPTDPGFVDEFNAAAAELAKVAQKVLKVEVQRITSDGTRSFAHGLGVKPDFVWCYVDSAVGGQDGATVSEAEKATWTPKTIRFTGYGNSVYAYIFSLK